MTEKSPTVVARKAAAPAVKADVLVIGVRPAPGDGAAGKPGGGKGRSGKDGTAKGTGKSAAKTTGAADGHRAGLVLAPGAAEVDASFDGVLLETLVALGATGRLDEVTLLPSRGAVTAGVVAVVGLGSEDSDHVGGRAEALRRAAGVVVRRVRATAGSVAFALGPSDAAETGAIVEGALLGCYSFDRYRSNDNAGRTRLRSVTVLADRAGTAATKSAVTAAQVTARAVNLARDLVNSPPSDLYPQSFATAARTEARRAGVAIEVLDDKALRAGGYGGLIGVGQGSPRGPRLVRLAYRPRGAKRSLAVVGKGITFDTGGISLKPNDAMKTMKCDMGGAAAVLAAVVAIAELELPIAVTGYAALAENMPSGTAQRPSDVITIYGGKTVEVLNTDAEGRLVLADGLVRAAEDAPDAIVDVATLTGAVMVALGDRTFGVMGNDDDLIDQVRRAADTGGEAAWPLPIPEGSTQRLESKVADIANVGSSRLGGALTAAAFLREFVRNGTPWAHLDIAGPAFNDGGPWGYTPSGGTGSGVRTLIELARLMSTSST